MRNNFGERENEQVILEYDPTWYDTTDSDENELDSNDDNDEYKKPTCNDSDSMSELDMLHLMTTNEAHPIDEPIEVRFFRNFMGMREIMNLPK